VLELLGESESLPQLVDSPQRTRLRRTRPPVRVNKTFICRGALDVARAISEVLMPAAIRLTLVVAVAALASASAVSAATPVRSTVVLDETFVYPVGDPNPCPFEVTYRNQGTFFVTTFVDANGTTIRELDRGAYFLESYSANGKVISSKSPAMVHLDPATNTVVGTGNQRHFIVPGLGILYAQAGRFVIDLNTGETISVSGLDVPLSERLCAALAPDA
jgi:hypothetical protein